MLWEAEQGSEMVTVRRPLPPATGVRLLAIVANVNDTNLRF
jgi:hypothetical protein